jgi:hypothetical protein
MCNEGIENHCKCEDENDENDNCECEHKEPLTSEEEQELLDNWVPPARYLIVAGGKDLWCDEWKAGAGGAIDVCWEQKIGGELKVVFATIFESSFTIVDYDSPMTKEAFIHVKKQNIDYITKMAEDAKNAMEAQKTKGESRPPEDINFASYN